MIKQGDTYWVDLGDPIGQPGYRRPQVVIQNNLFNQSRIATVIVCALSSNLSRANAPGNLLLATNEGGLPQQGVVVVSQVSTVEKGQLVEYVGALSPRRVRASVAGMRLLIEPRDSE